MIPFYKMHANGNDFIIIDNFYYTTHLPSSAIVQKLADRHRGIGFDQLLYITSSTAKDVDAVCRIFNASGDEAAQCGHGMACVAQFLYQKGYATQNKTRIASASGICVTERINDKSTRVDLECPVFEPKKVPFLSDQKRLMYAIPLISHTSSFSKEAFTKFQIAQQKQLSQLLPPERSDVLPPFTKNTLLISALRVGNPHCVVLVENIEQIPEHLGHTLSNHSLFLEKSNVEFMQIVSSTKIKLRTYERGIGENEACGSGACAAVAIGRALRLLEPTVDVQFASSDEVQVRWDHPDTSIQLETYTHFVFQGELPSFM